MWLLVDYIPYYARFGYFLMITACFCWVSFVYWIAYPNHWWWKVLRVPIVAVLWTDTFNMMDLFFTGTYPTFWWGHGLTIAIIPFIGKFRWAFMVWFIAWMFFGPSLFFHPPGYDVGMGMGVGFTSKPIPGVDLVVDQMP